MKNIALVGPFNPKARAALSEHLPEGFSLIDVPERAQYSRLADADYIIIRTITIDGDDIAHSPRLRLIHKWGAGYDNIEVNSISRRGVPVAICLGVNAQPVAEMAVLHMLAVSRNLLALDRRMRRNEWAKDAYSGKSYLLNGKKIGLVGLGNIGKRVAHMVQAFGASVSYYDVFRLPEEAERALSITYEPFDELLRTSDIVSVHVPLCDSTRNLIGDAQLRTMRPSAILINTSRGEIVDEAALAQALAEGRLFGAGLDAFSSEPPGEDSPFYSMENVVLTPHAGGNTADNNIHMLRRCYENILRVENGQPLRRREVVNNDLLTNKLEVED